jgi:hypothetical protein
MHLQSFLIQLKLPSISFLISMVWISVCLTGCPENKGFNPYFDATLEEDQKLSKDQKLQEDASIDIKVECGTDQDCQSFEYCQANESEGIGYCQTGCRLSEDSCLYKGNQYECDAQSRICVYICALDTDCQTDSYCNEGTCTKGCRLDDPNTCQANRTNPKVCDPTSRTCIDSNICCTQDSACIIADSTQCQADGGEVMLGLNTCNPFPCGLACTRDDLCAPNEYCANYGRCTVGCRINDPNSCPNGLTCDDQSKRCVATNCQMDDNCPSNQYCQDGICQNGCRINGCANGLVCNENRICVDTCQNDQNCQADEYCDSTLKSCRSKCEPSTHQPCLENERCDVDRCVTGCADDVDELQGDQNQVSAPFYTFPFPDAVRRLGDRKQKRLCMGDTDWLQVRLKAGDRLEVILESPSSTSHLNVAIFDPNGNQVAIDQTWADLQKITYPSLNEGLAVAGNYGIKIWAQQQIAPVYYRLTINAVEAIAPAYGCFNDTNDPADNQATSGRSVGLTPSLQFSEVYQGNLCLSDRDWYCFPMSLSDGVDVFVSIPPTCSTAIKAHLSPQNVATQIDNTGDTSLATYQLSPTSANDHMSLRFLGDPDRSMFSNDRWCLGVENDASFVNPNGNRNQCEDYRVEFGFQRRQAVCTDLREPNNSIFNATLLDEQGPLANDQGRLPYDITQQLQDYLILCQGEADVFKITPLAGDALIAWIVDASQPNDPQGAIVGNLEVSFMDAQGTKIGDSALLNQRNVAQNQTATAIASANDPVYIKVSGIGDSSGAYQLYVRRESNQGECSQDINESQLQRDDQLNPLSALRSDRVNHYSIANGYLCDPMAQGDEDWYNFNVENDNTRLCITSAFRSSQGNIDLDLFRVENNNGLACLTHDTCRSNQPIASCVNRHCLAPTITANRIGDGEIIHFSTTQARAGNHYLRVYGPDRTIENAYQLEITLVPPLAPGANCEADSKEGVLGNNDFRRAYDLGSGQVGICDAWICERERNEGDWYKITIPAQAQKTIHLAFETQQGRLLLSAQDPRSMDGALIESPRSPNRNVHCMNVSAGNVPSVLYFQVAGDIFNLNQQRIDYVLQVVPADLNLSPRGQCDALNGGLFGDIAWPTIRLQDL